MIIFQDAKSGNYWDGKAFAADIKEKALAYPHEQEREMLKILPSEKITIHGYVSSSNLKAEAQKGVEVTHARKLDKLADEVIKSLAAAGEKYLSLCTYIRKNEVAPKLVSFQLAAKGFSRATISKINSVANADEKEWNQYAARTIGFNKVLALTSGSVQKALADETGDDVIEVESEVRKLGQDVGSSDASVSTPVSVKPEDKKIHLTASLEAAAARLFAAAAGLEIKRRVLKGTNGYKVTIERLPVKVGKGKSNEIAKGKDPKK